MLVLSFAWLGLFIDRASLGTDSNIDSNWNDYLDRLYPGLYHRSYPRSAQTFLHQTPLVNCSLTNDSSIPSLSDRCESFSP